MSLDLSLPRSAHRFYETLAGDEPRSTRCPSCEAITFPPRERCPACGSATEWAALARGGTIYAFTQQPAGLRFTQPDVIGLVDLDDGTRVFGLLDLPFDEARIGSRVQMVVRPTEQGNVLAFIKEDT